MCFHRKKATPQKESRAGLSLRRTSQKQTDLSLAFVKGAKAPAPNKQRAACDYEECRIKLPCLSNLTTRYIFLLWPLHLSSTATLKKERAARLLWLLLGVIVLVVIGIVGLLQYFAARLFLGSAGIVEWSLV